MNESVSLTHHPAHGSVRRTVGSGEETNEEGA